MPNLVSGVQGGKAPPQSENTTDPRQAVPLVSTTTSDEHELVEEIIRETVSQDESQFPSLQDFDQEIFDMQLLEDLSKLSNA